MSGHKYYTTFDGFQRIQYGANMCRRPVAYNVQYTIRFSVLYGHALWIKERTAHLLPLCPEGLCKEVSHLVETYMDDCTVMSMEFNMHCTNVEGSLNLMEQGKMRANPWKSHFLQQGVEFLGHYVDHSRVSVCKGPHTTYERLAKAKQCQRCCGGFHHPAGSFSALRAAHGDTHRRAEFTMKELQNAQHHNHIYHNTFIMCVIQLQNVM